MGASIKSPVLLAPDEQVNDSPEIDLCSSSVHGEIGGTRDRRDIDKSSGKSVANIREERISFIMQLKF